MRAVCVYRRFPVGLGQTADGYQQRASVDSGAAALEGQIRAHAAFLFSLKPRCSSSGTDSLKAFVPNNGVFKVWQNNWMFTGTGSPLSTAPTVVHLARPFSQPIHVRAFLLQVAFLAGVGVRDSAAMCTGQPTPPVTVGCSLWPGKPGAWA